MLDNKQKAIDWASYVLPIFEAQFPEDDRPRKAIEAVKNGNVDAAMCDAARVAADAAAASVAYSAASDAADAAYIAADATRADGVGATRAVTCAVTFAAWAIVRANYGEDGAAISKVNLIWTKKEQLRVAKQINWLEYKPTEVWKVLLEKRGVR